MSRFVVDTNVPVVANGGDRISASPRVSIECQLSAIKFLKKLLLNGKLLLDIDGEIQKEYRIYLNPKGQPGVGDRFYQSILMSSPKKIERVDLPVDEEGQYIDFPSELTGKGFDRSDRKFAALGRRCSAPVVNAVDSDWLEHRADLVRHGIDIIFLCGEDQGHWFSGTESTD